MPGSPEAALFQQYLIKWRLSRHLSKGESRGNKETQDRGPRFRFQDISWTWIRVFLPIIMQI